MNDLSPKTINIGLIDRPVPPVRQEFNKAELERLTASICENGILVPLMVVRRADRFEVVDGDRRLAAAFSAGLREVPVVVHDLDDRQVHIQRMLANLDREDTDPVSEAKYIAQLIADETFDFDTLSEKLGRSSAWIANRLSIAEMPDYMQEALSQRNVTLGVCLELHQIRDENTKARYFKEAMRHGMTVQAAQYNRMVVNEAIDALEEQDEEVTEQALPAVSEVPQALCALTDQRLPINEMRMVRVSTRALSFCREQMKGVDVRTIEV